MARKEKSSAPGATELLEEAVHLLRGHPLELAVYYAGVAPFAVALLYAWARVTWFAPETGMIALLALGLTGLFGLMKVGQHFFAARLYAYCAGEVPPRWGMEGTPEKISAEFRLQTIAALAVPVSALLMLPFGWVYGYFQSATVASHDSVAARRREAWELACLWPAQNTLGLLMLGGLWFVMFLNVAAAFYVVPKLAAMLLGLNTIFAISGWSYFNTTMMVLLVTLTHLLVDPLVKTFYVVRVFHARARHTGADIRLVLAREKQMRAKVARVALVLVSLWWVLPTSGVAAERTIEGDARGATVQARQLDHALDDVLKRSEFEWRLRQPPAARSQEEDSAVKGFVRATFRTLKEMVAGVGRVLGRIKDWFDGLFPEDKTRDAGPAQDRGPRDHSWMSALRIGAYVLLFVVLGLLLLVAWRVWRHNRRTHLPVAVPTAPAGVPDLRDETVEASRLPADGWLDLARQKMAEGEWRLAMRALFLASLARLAGEGMVTLARFKTNYDYERELRRRARGRVEAVDEFRSRRRQFEDTWYGDHPVEAARVGDWLRQLEGKS